MANNQVRINSVTAEKILKGQIGGVVDVMEDLADRIMSSTGQPAEYERETWVGINRARVSVVTATQKARRDEATDHTLLGALGSVQGG